MSWLKDGTARDPWSPVLRAAATCRIVHDSRQLLESRTRPRPALATQRRIEGLVNSEYAMSVPNPG